MTDFDMLLAKIKDNGMTITSFCLKAGIKRANFYNRKRGMGEFTASEIVRMATTLHLTKPERDSIFLTKNVK